jgi:hypothetical protein
MTPRLFHLGVIQFVLAGGSGAASRRGLRAAIRNADCALSTTWLNELLIVQIEVKTWILLLLPLP